MAQVPTLIFCGGGNPRFAEIAITAGYKYGAQLPNSKPYAPVYFADQNWKKPDRVRYMEALAQHCPHMATVLDFERLEQLDEVLSWAEEAARYVRQYVVVIPKAINETYRIPCSIGGKEVVLGFSVPTRFGATSVPVWEFEGRKIHLLGGSPHRQMHEWHFLSCAGEVVTADGNMAQKMATRYCAFWTAEKTPTGHWQSIFASDGQKWGQGAPYEAFRRSMQNIRDAWKCQERGRGR